MIGIFLMTHASLGEALIQCVCHVMGQRPPQIAQIGVCEQDEPDALLPQARQMRDLVDSGQGVLVLTDVCGATPSNIALKLFEAGRTEIVAGVNVPLLLRVLNYREETLEALVKRAIAGGCDGVSRLTPEA